MYAQRYGQGIESVLGEHFWKLTHLTLKRVNLTCLTEYPGIVAPRLAATADLLIPFL